MSPCLDLLCFSKTESSVGLNFFSCGTNIFFLLDITQYGQDLKNWNLDARARVEGKLDFLIFTRSGVHLCCPSFSKVLVASHADGMCFFHHVRNIVTPVWGVDGQEPGTRTLKPEGAQNAGN